jgi:hypothetical protein
MGLKEKQALASVSLEWTTNRLKEATGKDIKVEIDTESFANDADAIDYLESRAKKVANGVAALCHNDIGKDAFNEKKIVKIKLVNIAADSSSKKSITISKGVLTVTNNVTTENFSDEREIKDIIENML